MTLNQLKYVIAISKENSLNDAAKKLYISQPSLTAALHALEKELGFDIFLRSKSGVALTVKGTEFLGYARSVVEQYDLLDAKYISKTNVKRNFHVSMQHYTFAVSAFVELTGEYGMDEYEFEIHETRTYEVIENVKNQKSEIGVLYLNDHNETVLQKIFKEGGLKFTPLFSCSIYVYMSRRNPLAEKRELTMEELEKYPCLAFSQGDYNSFYFAEEVMSTYEYKKLIRVNDRATMLNLMTGINGYTLCSGIICEELNGSDYCAVRLKTDEKMTIGYLSRQDAVISEIGRKYIEILSKYKEKFLLKH
ncbi:MAG: LysR family transcriptional regulator [Lachnospiraceae bacterium]|nr:LysR family transcriptional regulator [Lachnospiraceae bacterium]